MNTRPIDKSKNSNIKCEHCKYFQETPAPTAQDMCLRHNRMTRYYKRCKQFEWHETKKYL
jgi:hypothetical protein